MTETFDLSKIRKGLQIQDEELLNKYLKEIWSDLSKRTKDTTKGITKVTFNKYYDLPGIISILLRMLKKMSNWSKINLRIGWNPRNNYFIF